MGFTLVAVAGVLVIAGLALGMALFVQKIRSMKGEVDQAKAEFRSQVGYPYASMLTTGQPPTREKSTALGKFSHYFEITEESGSRWTAQTWTLEPPVVPRAKFQLFDKTLLSSLQSFLNLVGPFQRVLTIRHPGPHPIGDAELDARFTLYADDPSAASALLRDPALKQALLGFASVSLLVDERGASFGDPSDANVYAWGASRTDLNPAPAIRSALRVHLAIEKLLGLVSAP